MRRSQAVRLPLTQPSGRRGVVTRKPIKDGPGERGGWRVATARKPREYLIEGEEESGGERQQCRPRDAARARPHDNQNTQEAQADPNPGRRSHPLAQDGGG